MSDHQVLQHQALQYQLLHQLGSALKHAQRDATFACGGSIPIIRNTSHNGRALSPTTQTKVDYRLATKPVIIRFGPNGTGQSLTLPTNVQQDPGLAMLLVSTQPAQFGVGGRNVFDETYRKAGQLDPSEFCTNFSPYEAGIMDIINQALVPPVAEYRAARAELYKLNVYSGPSGRFKAHVDTPRSDKQIGSLVVCFPSPFEGK